MSDIRKLNGKDLIVYNSGHMIGCDTECSVEVSTSMSDATSKCDKDANGVMFQNQVPSINSLKVSGQGLIPVPPSSATTTSTQSADDLIKLQLAQTKLYITFKSLDSGIPLLYGFNAYITQIKVTGNHKDVAQYTYEFVSTGTVDFIPVS